MPANILNLSRLAVTQVAETERAMTAMDMWKAYKTAVNAVRSQATVSFHLLAKRFPRTM